MIKEKIDVQKPVDLSLEKTEILSRNYAFIPPHLSKQLLDYYQTMYEITGYAKYNRYYKLQKMSMQHAQTLSEALGRTPRSVAMQNIGRGTTDNSPIVIWDHPTEKLLYTTNSKIYFEATRETLECAKKIHNVDEFFIKIFNINPVNNKTKLMRVDLRVPDKLIYNNAGWVPSFEKVIAGEYDDNLFNAFSLNQDILTHEFGHAVTQYSSNLNYRYQSGALNESLSDVFAIMCKQRLEKTDADSPDANWLIADNLLKGTREGTAMRSMSNPGSAFKGHPAWKDDDQVGHMNEYRDLPQDYDYGGVHFNSGIPNRAFYLASSHIGGGSWEKAGSIWYNALIKADKDETFHNFANRTISECKTLSYGNDIHNIVCKAWQDVGIDLRMPKSPTKHKKTKGKQKIEEDTQTTDDWWGWIKKIQFFLLELL